MNGPATGPQVWTARRLWTVAVLAALIQAGLIYWASDRSVYVARTAPARPLIQFAGLSRSELLALTDPTVFSRAHPNGFSGPAWVTITEKPDDPETNSPSRWLPLAPAQLGGVLREYVRTNLPAPFAGAIRTHPTLTQPRITPSATMRANSTWQVIGPLAARELMNFPPLPAQTNTDILLPSEVQLLVDAQGNPISAVLLPPGSGLKAADQLAVTLARAAQFAPDRAAVVRSANDSDAGIISGQMIFRWHTAPAPASANGPSNPR